MAKILSLKSRGTGKETPAEVPCAVIRYSDGQERKVYETRTIGAETMGERRLAHLNAIGRLMMSAEGEMGAVDVNAIGDMLSTIAADIDGDMLHLIDADEPGVSEWVRRAE